MLERMRAAIGAELKAHGVNDTSEMRETILIRNGLYCGRKFECQGHHVVWFTEENQIKFFSPSGNLILATSPQECLTREVAEQPSPAILQPTLHQPTLHQAPAQPQTQRRAA